MEAYLELAARLNNDLWARRGNNNGGKIFAWENRYDPRKKGVQIVCQGKIEDVAKEINGRQMRKAVKDAYLTICKRIGLEPNLPKKNDYDFRPTYYEWHFTDGNGKLLLVWVDPIDDLCNLDSNGNQKMMQTYDEVLAECKDYVESGNMFFEVADQIDEREGFFGIKREAWERLPENVAEIMAQKLYQAYIA